MESLLLFFTILGALVGLFNYIQKYVKEPEESKNILLSNFQHGKKLNEELIKEVEDYAEKNGSNNAHFMEGLTFRQCINILKDAKNQLFTDEHEEMIKKANCSKDHLDHLNQQIQKQILYHTQIKNSLKWYFKEE